MNPNPVEVRAALVGMHEVHATAGMRMRYKDTIRAAARAWLDLFEECQECEDGFEYPSPDFTESHPLPVPCPACNGSGVTLSVALVEVLYNAAARIWNASQSNDESFYAGEHLEAALGAFLGLGER